MDKVSKRNIRKGSAALRILEILWSYPEVQRKHIGIANGSFSEEQVSRAAKYLLDTGCIEAAENSKGATIYRLGKKGLNFLEDETDYYYANRKNRPAWEQQEADARARRLETECMFAGIGVRVMPSEKPTLADLATAMTDYIWEEGESQNRHSLYQKVSIERIREYLHDGIYYTSRECRALLKKDSGFETKNQSRFVGMVFLKTITSLSITY